MCIRDRGQVAHKGCALHEHHGRKDLTAVMGEGTEDANADAGKPILLDGKGHEKKTQDSTGKSNAEAWGKKAGKKAVSYTHLVYIKTLRKKIDHDFEPKLLHTVRGAGYVLKE